MDYMNDASSPLTMDGLLKFSAKELEYLNKFLEVGDRGGYYVAMYELTGNEQCIVQAQVSTFSEGTGGAAWAANAMLQLIPHPLLAEPKRPYPGVYYLSQKVAQESELFIQAKFKLNEDITKGGNKHTGYLDSAELFASANNAWKESWVRDGGINLEYDFPGNWLNTLGLWGWASSNLTLPPMSHDQALKTAVDAIGELNNEGRLTAENWWDRLRTTGALVGFMGGVVGGGLFGKRTLDYLRRPDEYTMRRVPDTHYYVAINKATGKTVGIFDWSVVPTSIGDVLNLFATNIFTLAALVAGGPTAAMGVMAAKQLMNDLLAEVHRRLTEDAPGSFNGDFSPLKTSGVSGNLVDFRHADAPTSNRDTRWGTGGAVGTFFYSQLYADTLRGGGNDDALFGGDGGDELHGDDGADIVFGQKGDDKLYGEAGNDVLRGGMNNDTLYGGDGNDLLDGDGLNPEDAGRDILYGEGGDDVLSGGSDDDKLYGGENNDVLAGGAGRDVLFGDSGKDALYGNDGSDQLFGGDGDDTLEGGSGNDFLDGGFGADRYVVNSTRATIVTSEAGDSLLFRGRVLDGTGVIQAIGADTRTWVDASVPHAVIRYELNTASAELRISSGATSVLVKDFQNGDLGITVSTTSTVTPPAPAPLPGFDLTGSAGYFSGELYYDGGVARSSPINADEHFVNVNRVASVGSSIVAKVVGRGGNDMTEGGLDTPANPIYVTGGGGSDRIFARTAQTLDEAVASQASATASGLSRLLLDGGAGRDEVFGAEGDDALFGGADGDVMVGGAGRDVIYADGDAGRTIKRDEDLRWVVGRNDPTTTQTLVFNGPMYLGMTVNPESPTATTSHFLVPLVDELSAIDFTGLLGLSGVSVDGIPRYASTPGKFYGPSGQDSFTEEADIAPVFNTNRHSGDDVIYAGSGDDLVNAGGGNDFVDAGADNDAVAGYQGDDEIHGGGGDDALYGDYWSRSLRPDTVDAGGVVIRTWRLDASLHGADYIDGGAGNDRIEGNGGADFLLGGTGNDQLYGDENRSVDGKYITDAYGGNDYIDAGDDDDSVQGGAKDDFILGGAGKDTLFGDNNFGDLTPAAGEVTAAGADYIDGGNDNDRIWGEGGADQLFGGSGDDQIMGDGDVVDLKAALHGDDHIDGEDGWDKLFGGGGNDRIFGGNGNDWLAGEDQIESNASTTLTGDDYLSGESGDDILVGGVGTDQLFGGDDKDTLFGGTGHDFLDGGSGDDQLAGGEGNDTLTGGAGADNLQGGAGDDLYVFMSTDMDIVGGLIDTITDKEGKNRIQIDGVISELTIEKPSSTSTDMVVKTGATRGVAIMSGLTGNVRSFELSDGTSIAVDRLVAQKLNTDVVTSSSEDDVMVLGGSRGDYLYSHGERHTVSGGLGNDQLVMGGRGGAEVRFFAGDGIDKVIFDPTRVADNTLAIGGGLTEADIQLQRTDTGKFKIAVGTAGDGMTFDMDNVNVLSTPRPFDLIRFDTHAISWADLMARGVTITASTAARPTADIDGTNADDTIITTSLSAGGRMQTVRAGLGNDTLVASAQGPQTLIGGAGDDTYRLARGSAHGDIVDNRGGLAGEKDKIVFDFAYDANVWTFRSGTDLGVRYAATDAYGYSYVEGMTVKNFFGNVAEEVVEFAGGVSFDRSNMPTSDWQVLATAGDDRINLMVGEDRFDGLAGADVVYGMDGNDELIGGSGDDSLRGEAGNDTLVGGSGNDDISGGEGADVIRFGRGEGRDSMMLATDSYSGGGAVDVIELSPGITTSDVVVRFNYGLEIGIKGSEDAITVLDERELWGRVGTPVAKGWDTVALRFATGEYWDAARLIELANTPTPGDDTLLGGAGPDAFNGLSGNDVLYGYAGTDSLVGGAGGDIIFAGEGDDTLDGGAADNAADQMWTDGGRDTVIFGIGSGHDRISFEYEAPGETTVVRLGAGITPDDLILTAGTDSNLRLVGSADSLSFFVNGDASYAADTVLEFVGGARWKAADVLSRSIPLLGAPSDGIFTGSASGDWVEGWTGIANSFNGQGGNDVLRGGYMVDSLNGGDGNDWLYGDSGNDTLNGGTGRDVMLGGAHNDIYVVDSTGDVVHELVGEGRDRVDSSTSYTLGANVEDLTLTGAASINATGNELANTLNGNSANNRLDGKGGLDTMAGGAGDDVYVVDRTTDVVNEGSGAGTDTVESIVDWTLGNNLENLVLLGTAASAGTGNALNNQLTGNSSANRLTGNGGNDTLSGGAGNNTYVFGRGDGQDVIQAFSDSATGKLNTLEFKSGVAPTDIIRKRVDDPVFGPGSSLEVSINSTSDKITIQGFFAAGGATNPNNPVQQFRFADNTTWNLAKIQDFMSSNVAPTVATPIPDLTTAEDAPFSYTFPSGTFTDANASDVLTYSHALAGGAAWPAWLTFNATTRTFSGTPTNANVGTLNIVVTASDGSLTATDTFALTVSNTNDTPVLVTPIADQSATQGTPFNFTFASATFSDPDVGDSVSYPAPTRADGTALPSWLTFNGTTRTFSGTPSAAGTISVKVTAKDIAGLTATDVFDIVVAAAPTGGSTINGTAGNDTLTGTSGDDTLNGFAGLDTLNGGLGNDTMVGGTGDDTYVVDSAADVVKELAGEGTDTIQTAITLPALAANVEKLLLTGTAAINGIGNDLDNVITGNAANNRLEGGLGTDTLNGGAGIDNMVGGAGNDTYIVENGSDTVTENANEGTDTVTSSVTWTLAPNFENLSLFGAAAINGTGNAVNNGLFGNAANNTLTGLGGNDVLNGQGGADTLIGGIGDDSYYVDNLGDVTTENAGEGTDVVCSSITWNTLAPNIENLTLLESAAIDGSGNAANNTLTGNSSANVLTAGAGNDVLIGKAGSDRLIGGTGADEYRFEAGYGVDTIVENDATAGVVDFVRVTGTLKKADAKYSHVGNDLEVLLNGTSDKIIVKDWYLGSQYRVEEFRFSDGTVLQSQVESLVSAMATFTASSSSSSGATMATHEIPRITSPSIM